MTLADLIAALSLVVAAGILLVDWVTRPRKETTMRDKLKEVWQGNPVRVLYALAGAVYVGYLLFQGTMSVEDLFVLVGLAGGGEVARASVYSPKTVATKYEPKP